jgi:hypothetical protein
MNKSNNYLTRPSVRLSRPSTTSLPPNTFDKTTLTLVNLVDLKFVIKVVTVGLRGYKCIII